MQEINVFIFLIRNCVQGASFIRSQFTCFCYCSWLNFDCFQWKYLHQRNRLHSTLNKLESPNTSFRHIDGSPAHSFTQFHFILSKRYEWKIAHSTHFGLFTVHMHWKLHKSPSTPFSILKIIINLFLFPFKS